MPAKKMKASKCKKAPREKSKILEEEFLKPNELALVKKWIKKGAIFVVLGSEFTYTKKFYQGLSQLMYQPTYNGAAMYDAYYQFHDNFLRPYIAIGLNDPNNFDHHIDNIKLLDRYRSRTLYTVQYDDDVKGPKIQTEENEDDVGEGIEIIPDATATGGQEAADQ